MQRDTSPPWCQGSQVSCATACSTVRPQSLDFPQQSMELGALPLNIHEISEQLLECTAGKPIISVAGRTSGSSSFNYIQIPGFRVWEMWVLLFQTLLKGHEKEVGVDDKSSTVSITGHWAAHQRFKKVLDTPLPQRSL